MATVKSLATNRRYVELQARVKNWVLHIQGRGTSVNRAYGVAVDVTAEPQVINYIQSFEGSLPSLAGSAQRYVPIQAVVNGEAVHVQVQGPPMLGRSYGAAFDITSNQGDLVTFIEAELEGLSEEFDDEPEEEEMPEPEPTYDARLV
jgi:hypothetical protein